ncbi:hypothetical protein PMKS-002772 [Pichia membranifaciens]|uniref:SH3 domain-containing protein n=1 Tax=Pichia membranifaciens TaxID=4926 RepID=A0A1Q2YIC2_9ASCO|nr:hypothetical protein PMKS-002772 [Pichia membranifaciens]
MSVPYSAIARYPYEPDPENASDDLPLQADQIITVTEVVDDDWLFGSYNDDSGRTLSGYFPKSFVEPYSEPAAPSLTEQAPSATSAEPEPAPQSSPVSLDHVKETTKEALQETSATPVEPGFGSLDPKLKDIEKNIVHEPENFKNKLQSFNVSSTPLMPMGKPKEESFTRKPFSAAEHRTSYIPPSLGTSKTIKKEEKKPDVISADITSESSKVEEEEGPRMTLKERMKLLQQQQEEEQKAIEAAMKRKEERKKAKQHVHHHATEGLPSTSNPENLDQSKLPEAKNLSTKQSVDSDSDEEFETLEPSTSHASHGTEINPVVHGKGITAEGEKTIQGEEIDENDENEGDNNENEGDHDDEDDEEDDEEDDDEETEEDEEELRKRRLAERMAKLSRGMGMMGMMGMMGAPVPAAPATSKKSKKSKKEKKPSEDDMEGVPEAIPILPMTAPSVPISKGLPNAPAEINDMTSLHEVETSGSHLAVPAPVHEPQESDHSSADEDEVFQDTVESTTRSLSKAAPPTMPTAQHPLRPTFGAPTSPVSATINIASPTSPPPAGAPPIPGSTAPASTSPINPAHPASISHGTPVPPTATTASQASTIPPIPSSRAPTVREAPPTPAITPLPVYDSENEANSPTQSAPPIPNVPPTMPHTAPSSRPPMPPPATTTTTQTGPSLSIGAPPPIPGAVPSIPSPTQIAGIPPPPPHVQTPVPAPAPIPTPNADNLSRHSSTRAPSIFPAGAPSIPIAPSTAAPPIPGAAKRHTTVGHAPPPPPPTDAVPGVPQSQEKTSFDNLGSSAIQRQFTRSSLETANSATASAEELPIKIPSSSSPASEYWWTTESLPPQLTRTETYFEVDSTDVHKRGGKLVKYLIYYVLDAHLTCITIELAYDTSEPERLLFFHETKEKSKSDRRKLIEEYTKYGPLAYNTAVKSLNKSYNGDYVNFIFSNLPKNVLQPIANKTFGAVVYRNNNGETKSFDDIRPGDILVLVNAVFEGHGTKEVGFGKPHVALITSFDVEKNRIKVIEQTDGVIQQGRYKLKNMTSGKLRAFRIVGRDYVNW